jgi:hypothetical protein
MVNDQPTHDSGGIAHESSLIGKRDSLPRRNLNIGLMQKRCCADAERNVLSYQQSFG